LRLRRASASSPVTLELGGKDPMLVLDDADLGRAVDGALWASFLNCGQVCSGVERIYVQGALYEPFVEELTRRTEELRLGEDIGPLISEEQRDRVGGLVDDALARGARALTGGGASDRVGWFYAPTVLSDVPPAARIEHEETFGPVVTVARVQSDDDAVRAANEGVYGLGASVWTRDARRAQRIARRLRAGSVWHNDHAYSYASAQASWGGRGESGFGRTHSKHGLYELTTVKFSDRDAGRRARALVVPLRRAHDRRFPRSPRRALRERIAGAGACRVARAPRARRACAEVPALSDLSHVDESGAVKMVDVGGKPMERRRAVARAVVRMAPATAAKLRDLPKGDALATAQLAGIMAAKRTSELIPLCHPLPLTHVEVTLRVAASEVEITASAETTAQTGVEMEALTAASVAARNFACRPGSSAMTSGSTIAASRSGT